MSVIGPHDGMPPPLPAPSRRGEIGRAVLGCAMIAVAFSSGCGATQSKKGASPSQSGNAIERSAEKGPVKLSVRVWPREPRLSDLVEMDVTVESQPDVEVKPPAFGQGVGDFLIRDYTERPPDAGGRTCAASIINWSRRTPANT